MDRRTNRNRQLYIERVIDDIPRTGHQAAARALQCLGIPIETTMRILTRPAQRRAFPDTDRRRLPRLEQRALVATKAAPEVPLPPGHPRSADRPRSA